MSLASEDIEMQKLLAASELQQQEMRYEAEMNRVNSDLQITHANNLVKLLTHHPKPNKEITA